MPSPLSAIPSFFQIGPAEEALLEKNSPTQALLEEESPLQAKPFNIDVLPNEIFERIFTFVTKGGDDARGLLNLRNVCVKWKDLVDNGFTRPFWTGLEKGSDPRSPLNAYVKQVCSFSESSKDSYFSRFKALTGALIPGHVGIIGLKADAYESALNAIALKKIWPRIQMQIDFSESPVPCTASAIRAWLNDPANAEKIAHIEFLDLSGMDLKVLPPEIGSFTGLQTLNLSNNQLQLLPPEIGALARLHWIHLSNNQLQVIPSEIVSCMELVGLNLSNNQLQVLPPEIGVLSKLQFLDLSNNQLQVLPSEIGALTELLSLVLSNNQLQVLPSEIGALAKLLTLILSNNQLQFLPSEIRDLVNLRWLNLSNNPIQILPPDMGVLANIDRLDL
ncbi:MAG: hypothetical protein JSR39_07585 [Verrucomicrobia bacterium]|nr:hypothetical protein [Verrucomicrobiota bacterium]